MSSRSLPVGILGALLLTLASLGAAAQDLPTAVTRRTVRAAVKITAAGPGGQVSSGSGSIIDARGYVLTNFHVVGHTNPGDGAPGTFFNSANEVRLAMVTSARDPVQERFIGRVVRADMRLDLALIRIVSEVGGGPIPDSRRFPFVPLASTSRLRPGSRLFAFGFPLGVRTINVTSGEMSGFQMNSREQVAWIRTDAEFNPGNSGGMLVDRQGRLVAVPTAVLSGRGTLEPIELARPVERIPEAWRRSLRQGQIDDVLVEGVPQLTVGQELNDEATGDGNAFDRPEMHYYQVPADRPLRISVAPGLALGLLTHGGDLVREGRAEIEVTPNDPRDMVLAVLIPPRSESGGGTLAIHLRVRRGHRGLPGWELPTPGAPGFAPPTGSARPTPTPMPRAPMLPSPRPIRP